MIMDRIKNGLWVVVPVYNEEGSICRVLDEWLPMFKKTIGSGKFVLVAVNDGSTDRSSSILRNYARDHTELMVTDKPNSGHGQSCLYGYRLALENGAQWIFQMDSDGQCDPRFFPEFWELREKHPVILGYRQKRDDGLGRYLISRILSLVTFFATGACLRDPNVPYRLMRAGSVTPFIEDLPKDFYLVNVLLTVLQSKRFKIYWVNIHFRNRFGGASSVKNFSFVKQGYTFWMQLQRTKDRQYGGKV